MKVRVNNNRNNLFCVYSKEPIEIGNKYIEVTEECLGEKIVKEYSYECLDMLIDEYLDIYDTPPEICEGE